MKFDPEQVKQETREDFDRAWSTSGKYVATPDPAKDYSMHEETGKTPSGLRYDE